MESLGSNWDVTMNSLLTNQEQRIRRLEEGIYTMESSKLRIESLECQIQDRCQRIRSISNNNEIILPGLLSKAQASSVRVRTVEANVEHRLAEMGKKLQTIMKTRLNSRPLPRVENDLNYTITQGAPSMVLECMSEELE